MNSQTPAQRVGDELRRARLKAGLTLADLGAKMGHGKGYVSDLERGRRSPTLDTLQAYADALGYKLIVRLDL